MANPANPIDNTQTEVVSDVHVQDPPCRKCSKPSVIGCHGIRNGSVYSEYYCERHYFATKITKPVKKPEQTGPKREAGVSQEVEYHLLRSIKYFRSILQASRELKISYHALKKYLLAGGPMPPGIDGVTTRIRLRSVKS